MSTVVTIPRYPSDLSLFPRGLLSLVNTSFTNPAYPSDPSLYSTLFLVIPFHLLFLSRLDPRQKILSPPLKLLQPLIYVPKLTISSSVPAVTKPSTSTQAQLLPSTSFVTVTSSSESQPSIPLIDTAPITSNRLSTSAAFSSSNKALSSSNYQCLHPYQLKHVLLLKLKPLYPIPYLLHPRLQNKLQKVARKDILKEVLLPK
ncbi:hypothetical protein TNCV_1274721 [Trichonephila clavipes]|nr:hypothetical protein TNCV_1274721 [Trichonephila clavipes]